MALTLSESDVRKLRQTIDAVERLQYLLTEQDTNRAALPAESFDAVLIADPFGQEDFTNNLYWLRRAFAQNAGNASNPDLAFTGFGDPALPPGGLVLDPMVATNTGEAIGKTHTLPVDGTFYVRVYSRFSMNDSSYPVFYFDVPVPFVWVKIVSSVELTPVRWEYTGELMLPSTSGDFVPAAPLASTEIAPIYNSVEAFNTDAPNIRGNSVDAGGADYPAGFALQPIRGNPVVKATPNVIGGVLSWFVQYENADDGLCAAEP